MSENFEVDFTKSEETIHCVWFGATLLGGNLVRIKWKFQKERTGITLIQTLTECDEAHQTILNEIGFNNLRELQQPIIFSYC